ncbi:MAG: TrkH family potassium uptake protein [Clostridiales bacterium]|nr:TrkH family potassium uptake protein [Clostridiales bacterium]
MNARLVIRLQGSILLIEAAAMLPSLLIALIYGDGDAMAFVYTIALILAVALPMHFFARPKERNLRAREGFVAVALVWVLLSVFGALPFLFSGLFTRFEDAFFEAVSGFTTTGASVLNNFEGAPRGIMFWRSFTHWIGGMGVLVLTLALLPQMTGRTTHLARAESPGPSFSKVLPKMGDTAKMMYIIYGILTALEFILLVLVGRMSLYDAAIHAMGTAGTGGFSNYGSSVAAFDSVAVDTIVTIFMVVFGVNFALYYRLLIGDFKSFFRSEELHWYLGIILTSIVLVSVLIMPQYGNAFTALRYGSFQVSSIISTTGFVTADFDLWPTAARMILLLLMFIGSCAGSTAGGMKVVRVALMVKNTKREISRTFQPRKVQVVRFEGKGVEENMLSQVAVFIFGYIALAFLGGMVVALEGHYDMITNLTASITCVSNVGPGFGAVGPVCNFSEYGPFAKYVLSLLMLCGRLELFPILVLFHPGVWRKG